MLEVLVLIFLGRSIRKMTTEKGLKPLKYVLVMIALWIGMQIAGIAIGVAIFGLDSGGFLLFGYLGAAIGATISYQIAKNAAPEKVVVEGVLDAGMNER